MANAPSPITSPPSPPGMPYDSTTDAPVDAWVTVDDNSGPADLHTGRVQGDFPDSGRWQQV